MPRRFFGPAQVSEGRTREGHGESGDPRTWTPHQTPEPGRGVGDWVGVGTIGPGLVLTQ